MSRKPNTTENFKQGIQFPSPADLYPQFPIPVVEVKTEDICDPYLVLYYKENIELFRSSPYFLGNGDEPPKNPMVLPHQLYPCELTPDSNKDKNKKKLFKPNLVKRRPKPAVKKEDTEVILSKLQHKEKVDESRDREKEPESDEEEVETEEEHNSMDEGNDYCKDYDTEDEAEDVCDEECGDYE